MSNFGGAGVVEVVADYDGDTYRAVYTAKFEDWLYVLHCFQKKSKKGTETPRHELEMIRKRFKEAKIRGRSNPTTKKGAEMSVATKTIRHEAGSGNVFEDIGVRDPEDSRVRAELALKIAEVIKKRGLRQAEIAEILRVDQAKVSKLVRGRISGFTSDRLLRYLEALGCRVRIEVKETRVRGRVEVVSV